MVSSEHARPARWPGPPRAVPGIRPRLSPERTSPPPGGARSCLSSGTPRALFATVIPLRLLLYRRAEQKHIFWGGAARGVQRRCVQVAGLAEATRSSVAGPRASCRTAGFEF